MQGGPLSYFLLRREAAILDLFPHAQIR